MNFYGAAESIGIVLNLVQNRIRYFCGSDSNPPWDRRGFAGGTSGLIHVTHCFTGGTGKGAKIRCLVEMQSLLDMQSLPGALATQAGNARTPINLFISMPYRFARAAFHHSMCCKSPPMCPREDLRAQT
jgi:hypothetical protein